MNKSYTKFRGIHEILKVFTILRVEFNWYHEVLVPPLMVMSKFVDTTFELVHIYIGPEVVINQSLSYFRKREIIFTAAKAKAAAGSNMV